MSVQIRTNSVPENIFDLPRKERTLLRARATRDEARIMRREEGAKSRRGSEWNERGWRNYYSRFSTVCPTSPFPRSSRLSHAAR